MGVVIGYGSANDPEQLRQIVLGAGLECAEDDVVSLQMLEVRVPQVIADLVLVSVGGEHERALKAIAAGSQESAAPVLVLGPTDDSQFVVKALRAGASEYMDETDARNELDAALNKLAAVEEDPRIRGKVISVFSPTPGCGSTTVASNLAAALGRAHPGDVAAMELSRRDGDLALFFDIDPDYTVEDACERWERLDARSLGNGLVEHETGVLVLAHDPEVIRPEVVRPESVRRVAVLLRSMFSYTVIDLESRLGPEQLEIMKLSDSIVVVLRPDVPAVRRAQRVLNEAIDEGVEPDRFHLLVNRWGQSGQLPLGSIEDTLELPPFQLIPDDPRRVNTAINQGVPLPLLARGAPITRRFVQLASQLNGQA